MLSTASIQRDLEADLRKAFPKDKEIIIPDPVPVPTEQTNAKESNLVLTDSGL